MYNITGIMCIKTFTEYLVPDCVELIISILAELEYLNLIQARNAICEEVIRESDDSDDLEDDVLKSLDKITSYRRDIAVSVLSHSKTINYMYNYSCYTNILHDVADYGKNIIVVVLCEVFEKYLPMEKVKRLVSDYEEIKTNPLQVLCGKPGLELYYNKDNEIIDETAVEAVLKLFTKCKEDREFMCKLMHESYYDNVKDTPMELAKHNPKIAEVLKKFCEETLAM